MGRLLIIIICIHIYIYYIYIIFSPGSAGTARCPCAAAGRFENRVGDGAAGTPPLPSRSGILGISSQRGPAKPRRPAAKFGYIAKHGDGLKIRGCAGGCHLLPLRRRQGEGRAAARRCAGFPAGRGGRAAPGRAVPSRGAVPRRRGGPWVRAPWACRGHRRGRPCRWRGRAAGAVTRSPGRAEKARIKTTGDLPRAQLRKLRRRRRPAAGASGAAGGAGRPLRRRGAASAPAGGEESGGSAGPGAFLRWAGGGLPP